MGVQINGDTGNVIATRGTFSGNVGIAGTLTYEDVTDIDAVGLVTARSGIEIGARPGVAASISVDGNAILSGITTIGGNVKVGTGVTLSPDGNIFATGVTTSTTFVGDLTGTATNANHVSVADNESTNENNLIPFIENASATGNVGLESDGDFTYNPSTGTVTATSFAGSGANLTGIVAIPSGAIILWSGAANAIPSGFVLCDGNNSTPNLSGKFVVGYDASNGDYDVGDTGGSESVTLTVDQIPAHTHPRNYSSHQPSSGTNGFRAANNSIGNIDTGSTGGGQSHENRPPFYALCYIMKT